MHSPHTTGNWKLGLALALLTAVCWGLLPIALKIALEGLDPYTITWYRFAASGTILGLIMAATGRLPKPGALHRTAWMLLVVALLGLTGNYVLYLVALDHSSPTVAQTVIQLGPLFFLLGGLVVFKETFTRMRFAGVVLLALGLVLFFNGRLPELRDVSGGVGLGVVLLVLAALVWAIYGLAQKQLLKHLHSQQILLLIYAGAVIILFPPTSLADVRDLTALQFAMLAFSCANTLVAYGAFAEALRHWEVSRIGAVLALAPLFTLGGMRVMEVWVPGLVAPERLTALSVSGALMVVAGSAICALGAPPAAPPLD